MSDVLRRWLAELDRLLTATPARAVRVHLQVVAFQALVFMTSLQAMRTWHQVAGPVPTNIQWPIFWAAWLPWKGVVLGLAIGGALTSGLGLVAYRHRWARLVAFVGLLWWVSALNSFGKIGHSYHHLLLAMAALALMPSLARVTHPDPRTRSHLATILTAQALVAFTYTMSGWWKVREGLLALRGDRPSVFTDLSLPAFVNRQISTSGGEAPFAWLVLEFPLLSSVLYAVTMLVELFALAMLATPRVAAFGAVVLASFHLAVIWTMDISFVFSIGTLVILFLLSPMLEDDGPPRLDPAR